MLLQWLEGRGFSRRTLVEVALGAVRTGETGKNLIASTPRASGRSSSTSCRSRSARFAAVQYNKRDLDGVEPVTSLRALLNPMGAPEIESAAASGEGVLETLELVTRQVLRRLAAPPLRTAAALVR
jgi:hypothetical protein